MRKQRSSSTHNRRDFLFSFSGLIEIMALTPTAIKSEASAKIYWTKVLIIPWYGRRDMNSAVHQSFEKSELQLERQLDRARCADLIQRTQAAVGTAGTQAGCQRLRRLPEQGVAKRSVGISKVRMIQDVKKLGTKTKDEFLRKMKLPLQRGIQLPCGKAAQHVASKVALRSCSGR